LECPLRTARVHDILLECRGARVPSRLYPQAEHPGMRTYVLAADTLEDLRGWLRALGRASRAEGDDW
jgi:hypothetical protein